MKLHDPIKAQLSPLEIILEGNGQVSEYQKTIKGDNGKLVIGKDF